MTLIENLVAVSIVSHGHGEMVSKLVKNLLLYPEVSRIIVTKNISEILNLPQSDIIHLVENSIPRGFGANHNESFLMTTEKFYCVLNPDITFLENPFPGLIASAEEFKAGLVVPVILNLDGEIADSLRAFPTPFSLLKRILSQRQKNTDPIDSFENFSPQWAAGMFMLFTNNCYRDLNGFDEGYYLYCEDIDICIRLWKRKFRIVACSKIRVIHDARRASRKNFKHLQWHLTSMLRYMLKHLLSLPKVSSGSSK